MQQTPDLVPSVDGSRGVGAGPTIRKRARDRPEVREDAWHQHRDDRAVPERAARMVASGGLLRVG
jgi:hypothetical protein